MSRRPTGNVAQTAQQFNLPGERIKSEGKGGEYKKREKRKEGKDKRNQWKRGLKKKRERNEKLEEQR